jgi:4-methylaminobutanoate oxidase (formaldehyde-forming)
LYVGTDFAPGVYEEIAAAGARFGLMHAGYHAMNSLRIEKAYRHWGHDITDENTPSEAGLAFTIDWAKPGGFIGKAALLRQKEQGLRRRLVVFKLQTPDKLLYHGEPIWRDDKLVGRITSGMFGHSVGRSIGLGYLANTGGLATNDWIAEGHYEIEIAAERVPAEASLKPFYDAANVRIKS